MAAEVTKKSGILLLKLDPEEHQLLIEAAGRSGRSKTREAKLRLEDSLISFSDLATTGRRYPIKPEK